MLEIFALSFDPACPGAEWEKSLGHCPPIRSLGVAGLSRRTSQFFGGNNSGWQSRGLRSTTELAAEQNDAEPARAAGDSVRELPHGSGMATDPRGAGV